MITRLKKQERNFKIIIFCIWLISFYLITNKTLHMKHIGTAILVLICTCWYLFAQVWHNQIINILEKHCDPNEYFQIHKYYGSITKREKTRTRHNYEMARAKIELDDILEAKHYLREFQKGKLNKIRMNDYHILKCGIAIAEQDLAETYQELRTLQSIHKFTSSQEKRFLFLRAAVAGIEMKPEDQFGFLTKLQSYPLTPKDKVAWNFLFYHFHKLKNHEDKAQDCYHYIVNNGQNLIYYKRLKNAIK